MEGVTQPSKVLFSTNKSFSYSSQPFSILVVGERVLDQFQTICFVNTAYNIGVTFTLKSDIFLIGTSVETESKRIPFLTFFYIKITTSSPISSVLHTEGDSYH